MLNNEIIKGYLYEIKQDSIVVNFKTAQSSTRNIALSEIKHIKSTEGETATMAVLVLGILAFLFLATRLPAALSGASGT